MKKSELKKILKPIVSECIKESLMEDGLISGIIAEVVKGIATPAAPPIVETKRPDPEVERMKRNAFNEEQSVKMQQHRAALMDAIGGDAYNGVNLFEGTTPAPTETSLQQQATPLSGHEPNDPGIDISGIFGSVSRNWNAHMNDLKASK